MTPAFHLFMPFRRRGRLSAIAAMAIFGGLMGSTFLLHALDLSKPVGLAILGSLLFLWVGREAVPLFNPGLSSRDGLTLDSMGLTLTRGGRTVQWRWDEISDLKLRGRIHPARLLFGRFISFRVPADGRRRIANPLIDRLFLSGRTVAIADDYPSRTNEIYRQMEHYRADAGSPPSPARSPEPLWSFRKDRKQAKLLRLLFVFLGPFLGVFTATALLGRFPGSVAEFLHSPMVFGTAIGLGSVMPWVILIQYRWESRQDNMLALSAGGIAAKHKLVRRQWFWRDILDMRVQQSVSRGEGGAAAQMVSFRATHDGSAPGKQPKDGRPLVPVSCSIEDFYETPIDGIARQARAWWDWSNETFGKPEIAVADTAAADGGKVAFRRNAGYVKGRGTPLDLVLSFGFVAPMLVWIGVLVWMFRAGIRLDFLPDWLDRIDSFLIMVVPMTGYLALMAPGLNRLELDEAGLLSVRYARKRRWAWHELGTAELRRVRSKWSAKQRAVITFEAPRNGIGSAFLRWAFNIDNRRLAVIEDIYDSPLDEIVEALNARRRKHGGRAAPRAAE